MNAQTIEVLNIPTSYGTRNVQFPGYSLEGDRFTYARSKLLNPANFGPTGTVPHVLNITSRFANFNSITSVSQLDAYDIIFIGSVYSNSGSFSTSEIDVLKAWSSQEKKVLIIAEQPLASPVSNAFGFPLSDGNQDPTAPTPADKNRAINIFSGPFGDVPFLTQSGSSQGYFLSSCIAPALARNANGNATILYDTTYNDLLIADTGFFENLQMQNNTALTVNSEIAWGNLWAWAVREVLTGDDPEMLPNEGQTTLISASPTCQNSQIEIAVIDAVGSIIKWETSTDEGATWIEIPSTDNPLNYNNAVDGQKFRALTSTDPSCNSYLTTETTVQVVATPEAFQPLDLKMCDDASNDGIGSFDLSAQDAVILGPQPAADFTVRYFRDEGRSNEISKTDLTAFNNTSNPQDIYVSVENNTTLCTNDAISFELLVFPLPVALQPGNLQNCVDRELENFGTFDLTSQNAVILGAQSASDFTIHYYRDATRLDEITGNDLTAFQNTSNPQEIFVRLEHTDFPCIDERISFDLVVELLPEIEIEQEYLMCLDTDENIIPPANTTFLNNLPINTRLSEQDYFFEWYSGADATSANLIVDENRSFYTPSSPGTYTVLATNSITGCASIASTTVVASYPPESISVERTSALFTETNIIEVTVTGKGRYEFRLNSGSWQTSTTFTDVSGCDNTIYVRDLYNCNAISETISIIDYPKFFTPNGDGYHDTWNITCRSGLADAEIFIFDRYGKLIKQLNIDEPGWDGTFRGTKMPSNDYWFTVNYNDLKTNTKKQFSAHFTLKR